MIKIGNKVPAFSIKDASGHQITHKDLLEKTTILYFYPRDHTPGCTKEACDFQEHLEALQQRGIQIIGVSPDTAASHQKFATKHHLHFTLLSDENRQLATTFNVCKEKNLFGIKRLTIERSTFVIDPTGTIIWIEQNVRVAGHVGRLLSAIQILIPR